FLAVGRPAQLILVRVGARCNLSRRTVAVGRHDIDFVLACGIADVGNLLAVWRPDGIALMHFRRIGEVPCWSFMRGDCEDVAPSAEKNSLPIRGNFMVGDVLATRHDSTTAAALVF